MQRFGLLALMSLISACLGAPIVAGDTLGTGTDSDGLTSGPDGPDSGDANRDPSEPNADTGPAEPECYDYDEDAQAAYDDLLAQMDVEIETLGPRLDAAQAILTGAFDVVADAEHGAAEIQAHFVAHVEGAVTIEQGPIVCPGGLAAAESSASTCAPDEQFEITCSAQWLHCSDCDRAMLLTETLVSCDAQCIGQCQLSEGSCSSICDGSCSGACNDLAEDGACFGPCDGQCDGGCLNFSGGCEGTCGGQCLTSSATEGWCPEDGITPACSSTATDCDGSFGAMGLLSPCNYVVQATGGLAASCAPPRVVFDFSFAADVDSTARVAFRQRLLTAEPAFAELRAIEAEIDRVPFIVIPPCDDADSYEARYGQLLALREQAQAWLSVLG